VSPEASPQRVAFLCLGVMGYPMAGHLARAGHEVCVYNRTASRAEAWVEEHGGRAAATPAEAAKDADFVFVCTGRDADLRAVALGPDGAFEGVQEAACFIDHTTVSAELARELSVEADERGFDFLDAPISGGQSGAENGQLTIMVGGEPVPFERALPLLEVYAKKVRRMGQAGAGQLTKMVNQICIAGLLQALSEGLHFAARAGLDPKEVVEVISQGAAQSWQMENRAATMSEGRFDFGFAVEWMRKDLGIALDEARRNGARLPITAIVDQLYAMIEARDGSRLDTSSLITLLE
jgi:3-hydroxyisobutyrate dehydrogenase-like beta-hydroxyacid dehydrogenase